MPEIEQALDDFAREVRAGQANAALLGLKVELAVGRIKQAALKPLGQEDKALKATPRVRPSAIVKPATASRRVTEREASLAPDHVNAIRKISATLVKRFPGVINAINLEINDRSGPKNVTMRVHGNRLGRASIA